MAALLLTSLLLLDHSLHSLAQGGPEPLQVPASQSTYGPDGPWQAVSVQLGTPPQSLDLYPGGIFQSDIFTNKLCQDISQDTSQDNCGSGRLFSPEDSSSFDNKSIYNSEAPLSSASLWTESAMLFTYSDDTTVRDTLQIAGQTLANFSMTIYPTISMVYPDGSYPLQVGALSLGPTVNQTFTKSPGIPAVNSSLIPGSLAAAKIIPSDSFGLHVGIGMETLKLKLSLWLGGYDASRIVGPVSPQSIENDAASDFVIDLLDIGIGVDHGGSPFPFSSQQGLLSAGNSSITSDGISVAMNPGAPYMNLPSSTCSAISKLLPVTYDSGKALYIWNVSDPQYRNIVTSPTYLSLVFRSVEGNLTIHVPFSLLNLTLEEPLVSTPTSYFPCQPPQGPDDSTTYYSLGRAFLQAAFIGVGWGGQGVGTWYLAQAPGPNADPNPQIMAFSIGSPPIGLANNWPDTWTGFWTALPLPPSPTSSPNAKPTSPPSKHGLSGGAIAGIAIGAAGAVLIVLGICYFVFRRRRAGKPAAGYNSMHMDEYGKQDGKPVEDPAVSYEPMYKHQYVKPDGEPADGQITREHVGELQ